MNDFNIIFKILSNIIYYDAKSTEEINFFAKEADNLSLITKTVYGVLENKLYIDYMIKKLSNIKFKKIHKNVLIVLEMGIYNIHFLESKEYAIVDKLVDLTKTKNKKSTGFVNAILRNFIRDEKEISTIYERDDIKSLSIRYSFPEEITRYIYDNYGMEYTKSYLKDANSLKNIAIRVNIRKIDKKSLKEKLESLGYEITEGNIAKNSLIVLNPSSLVETDFFKEGYFTIQQESSQKVVEILDPKIGSTILDLCAAPGTKTTYLAEYTDDRSMIYANDISKSKNKLIRENMDRLNINNIKITNFDASLFIEEFENKFDYVLVDAPCSGLGVVGRKPEIRYNKSKETILNLSILQKQILDQATKYLKKGGKLVYSTCTIGPLENKENFLYLKSKKDLSHIDIEGQKYIEYKSFEDRTDGFFISKFEKKL